MNYFAISIIFLLILTTTIGVYYKEQEKNRWSEIFTRKFDLGESARYWDWNSNDHIYFIIHNENIRFKIPIKDIFVLANAYDNNEPRYLQDLSIYKVKKK